jgi:hypothetical protein
VCSPRRGGEGGSRISPAAADGGLQPKLHGRRSEGPPAVGRCSSPGEDGIARQCSVVTAQVSRKLVQVEKKGRDSVGTTSKRGRERQNGTRSTR